MSLLATKKCYLAVFPAIHPTPESAQVLPAFSLKYSVHSYLHFYSLIFLFAFSSYLSCYTVLYLSKLLSIYFEARQSIERYPTTFPKPNIGSMWHQQVFNKCSHKDNGDSDHSQYLNLVLSPGKPRNHKQLLWRSYYVPAESLCPGLAHKDPGTVQSRSQLSQIMGSWNSM